MIFVTHSVFESVFLSSRILVFRARPGRIAAELEIDPGQPRDETVPHLAGICRALPAHLAGARRGDGRQPAGAHFGGARLMRAFGFLLPVAVLAIVIYGWDLGGAAQSSAALYPPLPGSRCGDAVEGPASCCSIPSW